VTDTIDIVLQAFRAVERRDLQALEALYTLRSSSTGRRRCPTAAAPVAARYFTGSGRPGARPGIRSSQPRGSE
jgi:hypothetical protein